jgi:hypothetical protein
MYSRGVTHGSPAGPLLHRGGLIDHTWPLGRQSRPPAARVGARMNLEGTSGHV